MKKLLTLLAVALSAAQFLHAQTPTYIVNSGNTNANQYPLGQTNAAHAAKVQLLYRPADFSTLPISGSITKIYFRSVLASTTATYSDFKVSFLQPTGTVNGFANNTFYTGLTPGLAPTAPYALTTPATASSSSPGWVGITLTTPFVYDNSKSLVVEVQYTDYSGTAITTTLENGLSTDRRIVNTSATATSGTAQGMQNDFGMDVVTGPPSCITAPTAPANAAGVCAGTTTLSWPAATGAGTYDVYLDAGTGTPATVVSANQTGTTYSATVAAGSYVWKVVPKNALGSANGCATFNFTVNPAVVPAVTVAAAPAGTICAGTPVTFTATPVNGGTTPAYVWKKGTATVGTNASTYTDNALNNGDAISVVLTSNAACATPAMATSAPITMTVVPRPIATATASGPTTVCQGSSVALTANTVAGATYQWQLDGTDIPTATSASYSATASGNYRVWISNGSCTDTSAPVAVTVNPNPPADIYVSGPTTFCEGATTYLFVSNPNSSYQYDWLRNGISTGGTASLRAVTESGSYTLTVTDNGCSATSAPVAITVNPVPAVTITPSGPTSLCQGGNVQLCVTPAGTGRTYQWRLNNGSIIGTASCLTAASNGSYCALVTNTSTGCAAQICQTVTVSTPAPAAVTLSGSPAICQGSFVQIRAALGTGYTYQWYRNGVPVTAGGNTYQYSATTAGSYYAVITNGACTTTSTSTTVTVNPLPLAVATAGGPIAFCEGGSVLLYANGGTGLTYQWRRNGVDIPGATTSSYNATLGGFYQVIVSNGTCQATSNFINVVVSTMPLAAITPQGPTTFCQSSSVDLVANSGANYTYQWQQDGIDIPGATAITYTARTSGDYTVKVTNGTCVATSAPQTIGIIPGPGNTVTASGPLDMCQGGQVTFTANSGNNYQYQWLLNGAPIQDATSPALTVSTTGDYSVQISDAVCQSVSSIFNVVIHPFPVAVISVANGNELSAGTFAGYQWYRNGVQIPGAAAQSYTATQDGYYSVVVTDANGCTATSSVQHITSLDINQVAGGNKVIIYPNPATTFVNIEATQPVDAVLTDIGGRQLLRQDNARTLDLSRFAEGAYLIRLTDHKTGALISVQQLMKSSR